MKPIPSLRLGKHERALLAFVGRYPGPHSLTSDKQDPSHRALRSLARRGLAVLSIVGKSVFATLADDSKARDVAKTLV